MKIVLESTTKIVELDVGGATVPARLWEGTTMDGVPVHAFITRIVPMPPVPAPRTPTRATSPVDAHVGRRIRERRTQLGVSQEKLAHRLGLSFQQVQKYEKATNRVSASRLVAIAAALDAPVGYFIPPLPDSGPDSGRGADAPEGSAPADLDEPRAAIDTLIADHLRAIEQLERIRDQLAEHAVQEHSHG